MESDLWDQQKIWPKPVCCLPRITVNALPEVVRRWKSWKWRERCCQNYSNKMHCQKWLEDGSPGNGEEDAVKITAKNALPEVVRRWKSCEWRERCCQNYSNKMHCQKWWEDGSPANGEKDAVKITAKNALPEVVRRWKSCEWRERCCQNYSNKMHCQKWWEDGCPANGEDGQFFTAF